MKDLKRVLTRLKKSGWTQTALAEKFNVRNNTISDIASGASANPGWKLAASLIALNNNEELVMPSGVDTFSDIVLQLMEAGWTQDQISHSTNSGRVTIAALAQNPGRVPRYALGDALIKLHARSVR